ncbi:MAG: DUF4976 domain-containing protein, partial [Planctomycetota bacterium]|nr:DUF4976 domain-containing protein [Planctomycetota bacterium]
STSIPQEIDGISLAPALLGRKQKPRRFLYREFPSYGGQQSIRVGDWKAIRTNMKSGNHKLELYNLAEDPSEQNNVADQHANIVERLEKQMRRQHVRSEIFPLRPIDDP